MTRFRKAGGHRRSVQHTRGDARRQLVDRTLRAAQAEPCLFPRPCGCTECDPDGDHERTGQ